MKTLTIATIKGGTGKTTTAAALAQAAHKKGLFVLLIDLDPQANLTRIFNGDPSTPGTFELITGEADAAETVQTTAQGIDLIAGGGNLATLTTERGSAGRLARALLPLEKKYRLAIIDTPPNAGELAFNAINASAGILCPLEADPCSLDGFYFISDIARHIKAGSPLYIAAFTARYNGRSKINKYLRDVIQQETEKAGAVYAGEVRAGVAIREAQALSRNLYEYAPNSNPAADYMALFELTRKGLTI